eukprot:TRINITY_DN2500_c0_g1_i3.p1 TRINITY_DN2500_c0_g1~~TRINITY_DN2500_c0_g1_i3.p1  ORF type:complete len:204 (+),score=49.59 TRINITY_DN2500_c0_g1_i3:78-689(+)
MEGKLSAAEKSVIVKLGDDEQVYFPIGLKVLSAEAYQEPTPKPSPDALKRKTIAPPLLNSKGVNEVEATPASEGVKRPKPNSLAVTQSSTVVENPMYRARVVKDIQRLKEEVDKLEREKVAKKEHNADPEFIERVKKDLEGISAATQRWKNVARESLPHLLHLIRDREGDSGEGAMNLTRLINLFGIDPKTIDYNPETEDFNT